MNVSSSTSSSSSSSDSSADDRAHEFDCPDHNLRPRPYEVKQIFKLYSWSVQTLWLLMTSPLGRISNGSGYTLWLAVRATCISPSRDAWA
eukprot:8920789-Pyramimonas_sp.AAC.1